MIHNTNIMSAFQNCIQLSKNFPKESGKQDVVVKGSMRSWKVI